MIGTDIRFESADGTAYMDGNRRKIQFVKSYKLAVPIQIGPIC